MDPGVSALERAFQLAKSGRVSSISEIRKKLAHEGYNERILDAGPTLSTQLRGLIEAAHSASTKAPSP
jgi:hypothetical protein